MLHQYLITDADLQKEEEFNLKFNKNNYIVICGGVIPKKDINKLKNLGVSEIFGPGTNIINACYKILNLIKYGKKSNI